MTTSVATSVVFGSIIKMINTLVPSVEQSPETINFAANTRFAHTWANEVAAWDGDERMATESLAEQGILVDFNGGKFTREAILDIDDKRAELGYPAEASEAYLGFIQDAYNAVITGSGKRANEVLMELQIEAQETVDSIETVFEVIDELPPAIEMPDNIDSEGPAVMEVADTAAFQETETTTTDAVTVFESIQPDSTEIKTELESNSPDAEITIEQADLHLGDTAELEADSVIAESEPMVVAETIIETPVVDIVAAIIEPVAVVDTELEENLVKSAKLNTIWRDLFNSDITADTLGELKQELEDCSTFDYADLNFRGADIEDATVVAQEDRIQRLKILINTLESIQPVFEHATEPVVEQITEPVIVAEVVVAPVEEPLILKEPWEAAGFKSKAAWLDSFPKKTITHEPQVKAHERADTKIIELNTGGKYSGGKGGNTPVKATEMSAEQAARAAKSQFKKQKATTTLVGMGQGLRHAFGMSVNEIAKMSTCKQGEAINIFPCNISPNQTVKGSKPQDNQKAIRVGVATFHKDGAVYSFGFHGGNMPANFLWPCSAVEVTATNRNNSYKTFIPCAMIVKGQFGKFNQVNKGWAPTAVVDSEDCLCFRPTLVPASSNNLAKFLNLKFEYMGVVECPKGTQYYGVSGQKFHVFLAPNAKGIPFNVLRDAGSLTSHKI